MEDNLTRKQKSYIKEVNSLDKVYELFQKELGFPAELMHSARVKETAVKQNLKEEIRKKIINIYKVMGFKEKLPVFLIETINLPANKLTNLIRPISKYFADNFEHALIIITSDYIQYDWVLPGGKTEKKGKATRLSIDRTNLYKTDIETIEKLKYQEGWTQREAIKAFRDAFAVKRVTEQFFTEFRNKLIELRSEIENQGIPIKESHALALQTMSRIMFIYFIARKKWLNNDVNFLDWFFKEYKKTHNKNNRDTFYESYLKQLFFKAFNNYAGGFTDMPKNVTKALSSAPYLNGSLYKENRLDKLDITLKDSVFATIFKFFHNYNFTIREDVLIKEVAVDPEMIGYVYESLANAAEEIYTNHDLGIFYTPREEVDFMCRNALVEYLSNKINAPKDIFYDLLFVDDKSEVEHKITKLNLWDKIGETVNEISVVDPACGSGAFLVGVLMALSEIITIVNRHIEGKTKDYDIKKRIIERNLYGVDVMPWAVQCAELRLWLQLVIESDLKKEELKQGPILPNLDLNFMVGDSVVQQAGGIDTDFNLKDIKIPPPIKKRIDMLAEEKRKYFNNERTALLKDKKGFMQEEIKIFTDFIDGRIKSLNDKIPILRSKFTNTSFSAAGFSNEVVSEKDQETAENEVKKIKKDIEKLHTIKDIIKDPKKKPFIWEMDFAEVFLNKKGFDIVIGNPPYLRQEDIAPPNKLKGEITKGDKEKYKKMLNNSVKNKYPHIKSLSALSGRSDLYIYFYFIGLSLLNPDGIFSFITSNSWLDVDYGKNLQEFLLKYVPIVAIYDSTKRSFEHADVNTVITLFKAPRIQRGNVTECTAANHTAKFVMFKKPFEEVITSNNLKEINRINLAETENYKKYPDGGNLFKEKKDFRVFAAKQSYLYKEGTERKKGKGIHKGSIYDGNYIGNKWGGKYLRAPEIYWKILEKGKDKLVRLGDIADVRFGIKTGANEFFYVEDVTDRIEFRQIAIKNLGNFSSLKQIKEVGLRICRNTKTGNYWLIEGEFLKPVIKSPRECKSILIKPEDLKYKVFMCHKSKQELKNTKALEYIEYGESKKLQKISTISNRKRWYELSKLPDADVLFNQFFNERFLFPWNKTHLLVDHAYYYILYPNKTENLVLVLNSVINFLMVEIYGRTGLGQGALQTYAPEMKPLIVINPIKLETGRGKITKILNKYEKYKAKSIFDELDIDPSKPIRSQQPNPLPDRAELDNIVFDELGLTKQEKKEVYWSVAELKVDLTRQKALRKKDE